MIDLRHEFSSPHGDFSFSMTRCLTKRTQRRGFRPLTGISLFLYLWYVLPFLEILFSSPHGDFSFSIVIVDCYNEGDVVFVPSRGFLFFYTQCISCSVQSQSGFRPLTGISLFLCYKVLFKECKARFRPLTGISLFL